MAKVNYKPQEEHITGDVKERDGMIRDMISDKWIKKILKKRLGGFIYRN